MTSSTSAGFNVARGISAATLLVLAAGALVLAADTARGTFTAGAPVRFAHVYATLEADKKIKGRDYLIILVSDVPVAPADQEPDKLLPLAQAGKVHAIRVRWLQGTDGVSIVPYHERIPQSGFAMPSAATINLTKLSDTLIAAEFKSKMLGQTWTFDATVNAAIARGGTVTLEPEASAAETNPPTAPGKPSLGGKSGPPDATAAKMKLGTKGFEFTKDGFFQAIGRHNVDAVRLYLDAGMSPNQKDERGRYALNHAVLTCGQQALEGSDVVIALVDAKADVKTQDPDNKTTALVGAVQSCNVDAVNALIKAGSDLTAKSAGGMTALQLADVFQRKEIADALRKAGAK